MDLHHNENQTRFYCSERGSSFFEKIPVTRVRPCLLRTMIFPNYLYSRKKSENYCYSRRRNGETGPRGVRPNSIGRVQNYSRESCRDVHFLSVVNSPGGECLLLASSRGGALNFPERIIINSSWVVEKKKKVKGERGKSSAFPVQRQSRYRATHARNRVRYNTHTRHEDAIVVRERWKSVPWPRTRSRYPSRSLGHGRPQSWLGSQAKMILLLACLSLLIGPGELGVLNNGHTVTVILGIGGALPFGSLAAGPR